MDLDNNFKYHTPKQGQAEKYQGIRDQGKFLAEVIMELCPDSRERTIAIGKIEEATMWANASIARNE